jgi:hypothetical protein
VEAAIHYHLSDYLLCTFAYGAMGVALLIGRSVLKGLFADLASLFKPSPPPEPVLRKKLKQHQPRKG